MPLEIEQTLRELVAAPSVNPMGQPVDGSIHYEHRVTDLLESYFQRLGLPCQRQAVAPARENIIARLDGKPAPDAGGGLLLFEVHQDTVPVDGMTIDPFGGEVREGRLFGRGACDVKGGMTAMLAAVERLMNHPAESRPTILLACTVNEEFGFTGAQRLVEAWTAPQAGGEGLISRRPDVAIVAEPTQLDVVVAHKGVVRWRIHTQGRAAHSSQPERGVNAIYRAARVLLALEEYQQHIVPNLASDPLCGHATLSVGTVHGGSGVNLVPEHCVLELDRRLVPGETADGARRHLIGWLEGQPDLGFPLTHDEPFMQSAGLTSEFNADLAARLGEHARAYGGGRVVGVPYGTDASVISASGVPTVVFGPGLIEQAHTADEWIELAQIEQAAQVLERFALDWQP